MKISALESQNNKTNDKIASSLKRFGFVNSGQLVLSDEENNELVNLCIEKYSQLDSDHSHFLSGEEGVTGIRGLPLYDPKIVTLLEKIVSDKNVKYILQSALGPDYKIWQIDFRRSMQGDKGLQLHQDGRGQLNLSILLSDNSSGEGTTIFLPGSHFVPQRIRDLQAELSPGLFKFLGFIFSSLTGKKGDISFFFNRTWHGRNPNISGEFNDMILIGFFPAGASMCLQSPYVKWPADFIESIKTTELGRLLDLSVGTELQNDGFYKIVPQTNSQRIETPFSLLIESNQDNVVNLKLKMIVNFLRISMTSGRPFKRIFRIFKGKLA